MLTRLYFADETLSLSLCPSDNVGNNVYVAAASAHNCNIKLTEERRQGFSIFYAEVKSNAPIGLKRIDLSPEKAFSFTKTDRILFFGNDMHHCTHRYPCELAEERQYSADCTGLFPSLDGRGQTMAMLAPFQSPIGAGVIKRGESLEFFAKTEFTEGQMTKTCLCSERVIVADGVTIDEIYDIYRALLPESHFPTPRLTGWNTWDYYLARVTPEDIFENAEALSKTPFAHKLDYIVIDDGWQKEWGEWVENEKFACGLDKIAARIKECGFLPGIWASPLLMKEKCPLFVEREHWFCRDAEGKFIRSEGNTCLIDPTLPEAHEFILDIYRSLYAKGFRLFKIDYLSPLLKARKFYDAAATPYSALRRLICDIQAATGNDAVILGCSLPVQCGADIAPSMRIGVDIHNHFSHVRWIAEILSWTWMFNNKTTRIDPDFLIVRGIETANEPLTWEGSPNYTAPKRACEMTDLDLFRSRWRQGDQFNAVEAETWAYLVAISGGNIFLSDRISALNERGIDIIDKAFKAVREECRPIYVEGDRRLPSLWTADGEILVVNWEDEPREITLCGILGNLESDKPFSHDENTLKVTLLPHESFLAKLGA